jgi:hypothetical protein
MLDIPDDLIKAIAIGLCVYDPDGRAQEPCETLCIYCSEQAKYLINIMENHRDKQQTQINRRTHRKA